MWKFYNHWAKLSLAATEVIWRRSALLENRAETHRMVAEKFQVMPEIAMSVWADYLKQTTRAALGGGSHNFAQMQRAALSPIKKRVTANRTRLRKRT